MSQSLSKCVDSLLSERNYAMVIDLHTGEYSLFHESEPHTAAFNRTSSLLKEVKNKYCKPCRIASISDTPDPSGHLVTYCRREYHVEYAFLFEVYGGYINRKYVKKYGDKCFKIFNPNFSRFTKYLLKKWVDVL